MRSTAPPNEDDGNTRSDEKVLGLRLSFLKVLTRFAHRLTAEARDKTAITSLRLLAVLTVLSSMRL